MTLSTKVSFDYCIFYDLYRRDQSAYVANHDAVNKEFLEKSTEFNVGVSSLQRHRDGVRGTMGPQNIHVYRGFYGK